MKFTPISLGLYRISDNDARRLAQGVNAPLPRYGYELAVELSGGAHAWLTRTPVLAVKRGWVWAVYPRSDRAMMHHDFFDAVEGRETAHKNPKHREYGIWSTSDFFGGRWHGTYMMKFSASSAADALRQFMESDNAFHGTRHPLAWFSERYKARALTHENPKRRRPRRNCCI